LRLKCLKQQDLIQGYNGFMRRFRDLFSQLRWKLTLTYTLVTVAALLVAEVGLIVISQTLEPVLLAPSPARFAVEYIAPQIQTFLLTTPPDTDGLNQWLLRSAIQGFQIKTADGQETWLNLITPFQGDLQMMVFDCQGALLATLPPETVADQRSNKEALDVPGMESLWPVALSGESDPDRLYKYSDGEILTTAAPIMSDEGVCLGILAITGTSQDLQRTDAPTFFSIIGASALGFAIVAGLIGLLFGFVASRGLSRRIGELSRASEAWSKGDFKVIVHDRSADELGQLTQRLNRMAEQLQHLLHSRQQLAMLEERNRLARDLHDSVKQQAFGLAAQLRTMRALLRKDLNAAEAHLAEAEKY
jgi:NarL family two-component system sensor histidine kinase LiaS